MATAQAAEPETRTIVNDLVLHVATANGSGSQTSNMVLLRTLFQMGIPVSGKNLFPSNIQGLPTWFTIRANGKGWIARKQDADIVVCMNPDTSDEDAAAARKGAILIYEETLNLADKRPDCVHYAVPFKKLIAEACPDVRLRKLVINMLYVGVCAQLFDFDMEEVRKAISTQLAGKQKAIDLNVPAVEYGYKWAAENLKKADPYRVERMDANKGKIIIEGNAATALGLMFGGVTVVTWYPITPSSSLCEYLEDYLNKYRIKDGKRTFAVVQAEDEIAAVGMLAGAGWAGARAFTSTSGPGISLMNEIIGLGYFAEIPFVICNVARTGPSTGLPTRTMQGDVLSLFYASHGDTKHIVVIPNTPKEAFEMAGEALDLAEEFQTPVFILSDLDLGMNFWMSERFEYPTKPFKRGKVLDKEALDKLNGQWGRYRDVDGDGIPYRTYPGTPHPKAAYFTRGTGHTPDATYSEKPEDWKNNMDRLARKFETAKTRVPKPEIVNNGHAAGLIYFGTTTEAIREALAELDDRHGLKLDQCRLRAFPFTQEVEDFIHRHERVYVVELNRDGQMRMALGAELPRLAGKLRSVLHYDGMPLTAENVVSQIVEFERK
ncbi:MAG: 2-oxoacid:acceptor oxidoreductase subunit alpha [Planctomycetes bacterium]|nr:2-oxoacid:acceptor oxidoreductase subunit alpha [Planctomycetota bacterium]MCW8136528.1 2-oxoacid:acceptor oxidoreductase subunit alpha [Planctomycetota bacterium]